jgi:hypothetical protein
MDEKWMAEYELSIVDVLNGNGVDYELVATSVAPPARRVRPKHLIFLEPERR